MMMGRHRDLLNALIRLHHLHVRVGCGDFFSASLLPAAALELLMSKKAHETKNMPPKRRLCRFTCINMIYPRNVSCQLK
jgi:hypothetical protein